jgi:phosphohistidine phosphatase
MKTLLLMRHAKSSWEDERLLDHDRPLNKRGEKDAPRMGRLLAEENLLPEKMLSSSALRALSTAQIVAEHSGYSKKIDVREELYHAVPDAIFKLLRELDDADGRVLVVGHNPGLEEFLEVLTGEYDLLPTASVALVELPIDHWRDLDSTVKGRLKNLWRPKELP